MATITGLLVIPTNSFRFGTGVEVAGKAGAAMNAGDVLSSLDGETWNIVAADDAGHVGVLMEDPQKGAAFASGALITVRVGGFAVANSTAAAIAEGAMLATGAAGTVVAMVLDSATVATLAADIPRVIAKAVTAVDASGGKIIIRMGGY